MRINRIEIYGFGKWNNVSFDLTDNLQVFYGLNAAGKSTLRQFIYSILFGFARGGAKTGHLQYVPKDASSKKSYGGALEVEYQGTPYEIIRTGNKKSDIFKITNLADHSEVDTEILSDMLGPIDQNTYERVFGFNQSDLDNFNDLGQRDELRKYILRMGAVGSDAWIELENNLKKEADKQYTPSSKTRPLDKKIKAYEDDLKQLQADKAQLPDYETAQSRMTANKSQLDQVRSEIEKVNQKIKLLTNKIDVWPTYVELENLKHKLENVNQAELKLDLNQVEVWMQQSTSLKNEIKELNQQLEHSQSEIKNIKNAEQLLKLNSNISDVKSNYAQLKLQSDRIQQLEQQVKQIEQQYIIDLRQLHPMSDEHLSELKELQNAQRTTSAKIDDLKNKMLNAPQSNVETGNQSKFIIVGVAAVIAVLALLLPIPIYLKILVIIIAAIAAIYMLKPTSSNPDVDEPNLTDILENENNKMAELQRSLAEIGQQSGFEVLPSDEWLTLQSNLSNYQQFNDEINNLKQSVKEYESNIHDFWLIADSAIDWSEKNEQGLDKLNVFINESVKNSQQVTLLQDTLTQKQNSLREINGKLSELNIIDQINQEYWLSDLKNAQQAQLRINTIQNSINVELLNDLKNNENEETLEHLQATLSIENNHLSELKTQERNILDDRAEEVGQMTGLKNNLDILKSQQKLAEQETEIKDLVNEWLILKLGSDWVDKTLGVATKGRLPLIMEQANQYFEIITDKQYQAIEFDSDDSVTVLDQNGQRFKLKELSKGTLEQLYIAIRFAFMQTFTENIELPIVIDDAFVAFDDERLKNMFELLNEVSKNHQVIYFTAKKEVYTLVDSNKVTNLSKQ